MIDASSASDINCAWEYFKCLSLELIQLGCWWLSPWHLRDTALLLMLLNLLQESLLSLQQSRQSFDLIRLCLYFLSLSEV